MKYLVVLACITLTACSHFPCDQEKVSDVSSPNKQLTATVVKIGCGAITKDATWLTLHRTGEKYDRSDDIVLSVSQLHQLEIAWIDDTHLSVYCRCREDDVRLAISKKGDIHISYK
jgi:hypothetical protein